MVVWLKRRSVPRCLFIFLMNLLHDNGYINESQFESLKKDIDRILKLLTSIVKTMNQKVKGK